MLEESGKYRYITKSLRLRISNDRFITSPCFSTNLGSRDSRQIQPKVYSAYKIKRGWFLVRSGPSGGQAQQQPRRCSVVSAWCISTSLDISHSRESRDLRITVILGRVTNFYNGNFNQLRISRTPKPKDEKID